MTSRFDATTTTTCGYCGVGCRLEDMTAAHDGTKPRSRMRVLLAEDDTRLAAVLEQSLTEAGWQVEVVHDGRSAYGRALPDGLPYDVLVLDWMLPELDGVTVCRRLRDLGVTTPVLMLTARDEVRDRIHGLDAGADDYLSKPFDLDELLARMRALHRRTTYGEFEVVEVGDLVIDAGSRQVCRGEVLIELSTREFDILYLLAANAGKVVSRYTMRVALLLRYLVLRGRRNFPATMPAHSARRPTGLWAWG